MRVFVSSERRLNIGLQMGAAHYSYGFVELKFVAALKSLGITVSAVESPSAIKHPIAVERLGLAPGEPRTHIAFRSTENLRPMAGARNICHFAWEFDVLRTDQLAWEPVLLNQAHMLGLMDEVWVPSQYSADALVANGISNIHIVRTPVCGEELPERLSYDQAFDRLATLPVVPLIYSSGVGRDGNISLASSKVTSLHRHLRSRDREKGRIFLLICAPGDKRKNILNVIDGFLAAAEKDDLLIIKLIVKNVGDYVVSTIADQITPLLNGPGAAFSDRVVFMMDYLTNPQMAALYSLADFYLSAPHCEGYNLPLLEAMAFGTVPVSNTVTAMADYITDDNAITIASKSYPGLIKGMAGDIARKFYSVPISSRIDIARAVANAKAIDAATYDAKAEQARDIVLRQHSERALVPIIAERLKLSSEAMH